MLFETAAQLNEEAKRTEFDGAFVKNINFYFDDYFAMFNVDFPIEWGNWAILQREDQNIKVNFK